MPGEIDVRKIVLRLPTSRAARIGAQAAVLLALVGGTAAYAANDTTVQLTVDGQEREVRVFGSTVDDVLEAADVDLGKRDVVAPALDERVEDGDEVVVRHARLLTVTVDGEKQEHWTTALTVDEALEDLNIRAEGARLSASRSTPLGRSGLSLEIFTAKAVTVLADGVTKPLVSTAPTVGDLLAEAQVTPGELDRVSAPLTDKLSDGMTVQVVRVAQQQVTETQQVGFETEQVPSADLYEGDTKVQTQGVPGSRTITYLITTADGVEESRAVVSDVVTAQPSKQVVLVGTKAKPAAPVAAAVPSGSVWDRLAQCESGGNWSINTGNGYYGGLQFSLSTWRAYGGQGYPHETSREYQISIAEKVQASQGWGAWPSCSSKLGLR